MDKNIKNNEKIFEKLEAVVYNAVDKINDLKKINKELKGEINELKRLLALSEKKADRLKQEVDGFKTANRKSWQIREKDIKSRLENLSVKLSAFERSCDVDS